MGSVSLWADYVKECAILQIIEEDWGFITFHTEPNGILWINDMYVAPEQRGVGKGYSLLRRVEDWGRSQGLTQLGTSVHVQSSQAKKTLTLAFNKGFELVSADKNLIILGKNL